MLVLTRKKGESIILANDIEITVLGFDGDQVKLGINAPKSIEIYRKELYMSIKEENKEAANQRISIQELQTLFQSNKEK